MQAARFLAGDDTPPRGSGLTMPLLMIQGEEDRVTPAAANAELLARAVPDAKLLILRAVATCPGLKPRRGSTS
jgi:pimeloyl-ACP methyl ester carboxylesterase